ncbi:uncharacterized protein AB675_2334 [Cyphellophora attinorum]|uniref:EthD domain-containing protein n=1 Tax=Cyphellophora attinorum TaxID=1664694 RepID=A0A0N1HAD6_9EURO|nr:uncharacterized protein AB675_2334 [Phialophora attinorum]KPI44842.1 hypothetical protein AB675_2334 [Phialophora attinorum]
MIKLVHVTARKPSLSKVEFYDRWLNRHGPSVHSHARTLRMKKCVQSHLIDSPLNEALRSPRGMLPPVDGINEVWWDSLEDLQAAFTSPEGLAALEELGSDEESITDPSRSHIFLTKEHVIFDNTSPSTKSPVGDETTIKVTYLVVKRDGTTRDACHKTWLDDHGPYVTQFAKALNMDKYVQSHTITDDFSESLREKSGFAKALDGITEVWIVDPSKSPQDIAATGGSTRLIEDEKRFVELGQSRCFVTKEHVIFDFR